MIPVENRINVEDAALDAWARSVGVDPFALDTGVRYDWSLEQALALDRICDDQAADLQAKIQAYAACRAARGLNPAAFLAATNMSCDLWASANSATRMAIVRAYLASTSVPVALPDPVISAMAAQVDRYCDLVGIIARAPMPSVITAAGQAMAPTEAPYDPCSVVSYQARQIAASFAPAAMLAASGLSCAAWTAMVPAQKQSTMYSYYLSQGADLRAQCVTQGNPGTNSVVLLLGQSIPQVDAYCAGAVAPAGQSIHLIFGLNSTGQTAQEFLRTHGGCETWTRMSRYQQYAFLLQAAGYPRVATDASHPPLRREILDVDIGMLDYQCYIASQQTQAAISQAQRPSPGVLGAPQLSPFVVPQTAPK
jgi:hypothetical protein